MRPSEHYRKTNHLAVAGFLAPFVAAGVAGVLILMGKEDFQKLKFSAVYWTLVPLIIAAGVMLSIKSIPLVDTLGDKDYAYSGLVLNLLTLFMYVLSLFYLFSPPTG